MTVTAAEWFGLEPAAAESAARSIAAHSGAELLEVRPGGHALFAVGGVRFAFVPGGEVRAGFDAGRFEPTAAQSASFAESAAEYGIDGDIREFTSTVTSPARTVTVPPLLVAVESIEAGAVAVPPDHPDIVRRVERARSRPGLGSEHAPGQIEWGGAARAILRPDWTVEAAWLLDTPSYDGEVARLAALGQRLLTPDEWEHACGAGATTLYRWGDDNPDSDPWSARTGPHREPNRFGLHIAQDPYREERTSDRNVVCGGDGGTAVCGGIGSYLSWLTIATAYRDTDYAQLVAEDDDFGTMRVRPALPLS